MHSFSMLDLLVVLGKIFEDWAGERAEHLGEAERVCVTQ